MHGFRFHPNNSDLTLAALCKATGEHGPGGDDGESINILLNYAVTTALWFNLGKTGQGNLS